ncbi:MAG: FAD-dependent monooxygenase [Verrucomicrobia bacterium]|nr:FAD-dependent monooxygenase [Verrucomicrobiota bacterium]
MKKIFLSIFLFCSTALFASSPILIVGGGPSGLAAAIEAKQAGAEVVIVEKRRGYTREQVLFLTGDSVQRLRRWGVELPSMCTKELQGRSIGLVAINHLEEGLARRASELGIERVEGAFLGFGSAQTAVIAGKNGEELIPYDILVAADGAHSSVRKALGIPLLELGKGKGASAVIPLPPKPRGFDISPPLIHGELFLRRIKTPEASIVFTQSPSDGSCASLLQAIAEEGWEEEMSQIAEGKAFCISDVEISLQQVSAFFDEGRNAIVIGDAAATASFFKGMGANTALKTAEIAGQFFKERGVQEFDEAMRAATNTLIEESRFLFPSIKK